MIVVDREGTTISRHAIIAAHFREFSGGNPEAITAADAFHRTAVMAHLPGP
jgi:hypothetical protein